MTDFFTRLAERALGLTPIIQPIIASMFEPVKGISIQDDTQGIVLEEEPQIEVTGHPVGVAIADTLPPLDKSEEELVAITLLPLERSTREPVANFLPPLETSASVPFASAQEPQNVSLPGKHPEVTSPGMPKPQASSPVERPINIPQTTILSSQVNNVLHTQSGDSASLRNRLESGESKQSAKVNTHVAMFPGAIPPSVPTVPASSTQTVSDTSMLHTDVTTSALSQSLPGTAQHVATTYSHLKERDAQRAILETGIMQGSPATKPLNSQHTPFQEERKRQQLQEWPTSSHSSPGVPAIQVTIGRIEVRATPAPTPPAPLPSQHTTSSAMSLDDYLRQREKGGH